MNPLTITWAPHIYTDIAIILKLILEWVLIMNYTQYCLMYAIKLTKLAFTNLLHPFQPFF